MGEATTQRGRQGTTRGIFLIGATVMLCSILAAYVTGLIVIRSNDAVVDEQMVIDDLRDALSTLKDAETGQRGYLLTGEESYALPYRQSRAAVREHLQKLDYWVKKGELPARDVEHYKQLVAKKLEELDETIALRRERGFEAALAAVRSDRGKIFMDEIRAVTEQLTSAENEKLQGNKARVVQLSFVRTVVFILTAVVNLAFLWWAYLRITKESMARERAAAALEQQKQTLAVTLASIGDGVIVTDEKGRITFMNKVAEDLTLWRAADAEGLECTKVFNIINETSRQLVESPVEKVLRVGVIVGLANHTVLIRKDGSEMPIDDSGAPIRNLTGVLQGTILVFRDFTEHKKRSSELLAAKEEAEAANVAKDNFLATLSHELRTPLTPVSAILSSWEMNDQVPPALAADVQMMRRNVDLEARLIDDLLDLTRIVRGKLHLNPEVADVHELVASVAGMYRSEMNVKGLRLKVELQAAGHFVYADPARLQQVFMNLLKNATKFTPQGGAIEVQTKNRGDGVVEISIRDNGIGMTREMLGKLFQPFEQGTDETVKRYGGLGLGLAISKALMDAQGGGIAADSDGQGKGSTFTVFMPCVDAPDCGPAPARASRPSTEWSLVILLVEDHADTSRVMSNLFASWGHRVTVAASIGEAMTLFAKQKFDLILSDIGLPDGTGMELMRRIRKESTTPAIALTGFGMEDDVTACLAAGFNAHLTKPVNFAKLEMLIQSVMGKAERRQE